MDWKGSALSRLAASSTTDTSSNDVDDLQASVSPAENVLTLATPLFRNQVEQWNETTTQLLAACDDDAAGRGNNQNAKESTDASQHARLALCLEFARKHVCPRIGVAAFVLRQSRSQVQGGRVDLVDECLARSAVIIAKDINDKMQDECIFLDSVGLLLDENNAYYEGKDGSDARYRVLDSFQTHDGFVGVTKYLHQHAYTFSPFASTLLFSLLRHVVDGLWSLMRTARSEFEASKLLHTCKDAGVVCQTIVAMIESMSLEDFQDEPLDTVDHVLTQVALFRRFLQSQEDDSWYRVNYDFALKLLHSGSKKLIELGWHRVTSLHVWATKDSPPPKSVTISKAGCAIFNGKYSLSPSSPSESKFRNVQYTRVVRCSTNQSAKLLKLSRESLDAGYRWTLSSASEMDLSGSIGDPVVYYHVEDSKSSSHRMPPTSGWKHVDNIGVLPAPKLTSHRSIVPCGEEYSTPEHEFIQWLLANQLIELALFGNEESNWTYGSILMEFVARVGQCGMKRSECYLTARHVLVVWKACSERGDTDVGERLSHSLAYVFPHLSDEAALELLRAIQGATKGNSSVFRFCLCLVSKQKESEDFILGLPSKVRTALQKILWATRCNWQQCDDGRHDDFDDWIQLEILCSTTRMHSGLKSSKQSDALQRKVPRSPTVAVIDHERRRIRVSLPIESDTGEYFCRLHIFARLDGEDDEELAIGEINQESTERCILEGNEKVSLEAVLPSYGVWNVEWQGLLLRSTPLESLRSATTCVDVTAHVVAQASKNRAALDSLNGKAVCHAGEIHSILCKLRGTCAIQMNVATKHALLNTAFKRGTSTLKSLKLLIQANGVDDDSMSGFARLSEALATAGPVKLELDASLKSCTRKQDYKGFKSHLSALVESGEVVSWMKEVTADDLTNLGADSNRLFQLLIEGKASTTSGSIDLNPFTLEAASLRADLFSRKQITSLSKRKLEMKPKLNAGKDDLPRGKGTAAAPTCSTSDAVLNPEQQVKDRPTVVTPTARDLDRLKLVAFLQGQAQCIKGSPEAFHHWLENAHKICSVEQLVDAVPNDTFLLVTLRSGDGRSVGIKDGKCYAFKEAVLRVGTFNNQVELKGQFVDNDRENLDPCHDLICPISHELMTADPVLAADGYTYERAAISAWFAKQTSEIVAAEERLAITPGSRQDQAIVARGVLSPMTHVRMSNLVLTPNKVVGKMARERGALVISKGSTCSEKKRAPLGPIA